MLIPVQGTDGVYLDVDPIRGREAEISARLEEIGASKDLISSSIRELADIVGTALAGSTVSKATVEFGLQFSVDSGHVISVIAKLSATCSVKISLEWTPRE
jgi:hypothetical protein